MNKASSVDVIAVKMTPTSSGPQWIPLRFVTNSAKSIGTKAFAIPNSIAPDILAKISSVRDMGARSSLLKEALRRSKVIATDSIDVVPNRTDIIITPGRMERTSTGVDDLMKNARVQATGKMIPQLMLGGLR